MFVFQCFVLFGGYMCLVHSQFDLITKLISHFRAIYYQQTYIMGSHGVFYCIQVLSTKSNTAISNRLYKSWRGVLDRNVRHHQLVLTDDTNIQLILNLFSLSFLGTSSQFLFCILVSTFVILFVNSYVTNSQPLWY